MENLQQLGAIAGIPKRYSNVGEILTLKPETFRYAYTSYDSDEEQLLTISSKVQNKWIDDYRDVKFKDGFRCLVSSYKVDEQAKVAAFQLAYHSITKKKEYGGKIRVVNSAFLHEFKQDKNVAVYFLYNLYDTLTPYRLQNVRDFVEATQVPLFLIYGGVNPVTFYRDILGLKVDSILFFKDQVTNRKV